MDQFKVQSLISQGNIVKLSDIDADKTYLQVGVYQEGNRQKGAANANAYAPYAIAVSEISNGGGGTSTTGTVVLKATVDLTSPLTLVPFPGPGLYVIESALVTNASTDLSGFGNMNMTLIRPGNTAAFLTTMNGSLPPTDMLNILYTPTNYINMESSGLPLCWPPPCNGNYILDGILSQPITLAIANTSPVPAFVDVYIKLLKIA